MENKRYILLILFFSLIQYCYSNNLLVDTIVWNNSKKLNISDFRGIADINSKNAAYSYLAISYKYSTQNKIIIVLSDFDKTKSWIKFTDDMNLLSHEQTHFNITELFARKFRVEIDRQIFMKKSLSMDLDKLYIKLYKELEIFQDLYDQETNFSNNPKCQIEWNKYIMQLLEEYKDFENPIVKLRFEEDEK